MIVTGSTLRGESDKSVTDLNLHPHSKGTSWKTQIFDSGPGPSLSPQAFLVEQAAFSVAGPHFHDQNQFQIVVAGGGAIGRQEVLPVSIHYAGSYTGYGPITAGPEGLSYLTCRAVRGCHALWMPEMKHLMKRGSKINVTSDPVEMATETEMKNRTRFTCQSLFPPEDNGPGAWVVRLGANHEAIAPKPSRGLGSFWVVMSGTLRVSSQMLPRLGCVFVSSDEHDMPIASGEDGLDLLVLQFPAVIQ